jgi:hypothetical protein
MRPLQLSLIGLGVLAGLVLSVALVLRNLPSDPRQSPEPDAQTAAAQAEPEQAATEPGPREEPDEPDTASATPSAAADLLPPPPASPPPAEPLVAKPAGSQSSVFDPLILPPSGLSGGTIAALPPQSSAPQIAPRSAPDERTASLPAGTRLRLSEAQQEKVRYVLQSHNIVQTETDFPLNPGTNVPQEVNLAPLPIELSNVVPNYRAYSYVFAQDRILIVITNSRQIGLVLPL